MIARLTTSLLTAGLITAVLLFAMQLLIASGREAVVPVTTQNFLDFVRIKRPETPPQVKPPELPDIKPQMQPDVRPDIGNDDTDVDTQIVIPLEDPTLGGFDQIGPGISDGEALPIVKVQPVYPQIAARRGLECDVVVAYDILPSGATTNARIVNPNVCSVFHNAALNSAMKYRYRPRVVNGQPVLVQGQQTVIRFRMEQ